ncbi:hypothetical protein NW762_011548 [Fusarium torreyae]|uniref:Uncharacterized protein n=1 Tax=Fusarium torreyae TaxID=1237075 RepID=A0A9W8RNX7_9HYPO|nr:hypothetical protein NW762_011548 [Fusarium torreyae]
MPGAKPSDRCLPYILRLQGLIEEIDDAMSGSNFDQSMPASPHSMEEIRCIRRSYISVKASITFPIGASPMMYLQLQMIDLLTCYHAIENAPSVLYQTIEWGFTDPQLLNSLSQAISAAKSLLDAVLYPYANPISLPIAGWEMLYRALPLAVRLDSIAANVTDRTNQLRKILDLPYVIRQVVLRMEQIVDVRSNQDGKGLFHQLRRQAGELEQLYMESPNEHESLRSETPSYGDFYTLDPALTLTQCDEIDVMLGL